MTFHVTPSYRQVHLCEITSHCSVAVCETAPSPQCYNFWRQLTHGSEVKHAEIILPLRSELCVRVANNTREENSTLYVFTKDIKLISNVPRKKKKRRAVVLMSSMHHSIETDLEIQKPEIIAFYNRTKGGVDSLDEKCSVHSCSRRTTRWSMALFYRLLDMSTVNACILHQGSSENPVMIRMVFLKALVQPLLYVRVKNPSINRDLRLTIKRILGKQETCQVVEHRTKETQSKSRKTCRLCPPPPRAKKERCLSCKDVVFWNAHKNYAMNVL